MKKTTKLDKLKLKTETVRPLKPADLTQAAGGLGPKFSDANTCTCRCNPN